MASRSVRVGVLTICLLFVGTLVVASGEGPTHRGDMNDSGEVDISDVIYFLQFLFRGGDAPICVPVADANSDGGSDIGDAVYLLGVIFRGQGSLEPLDADESAACDQGRVVRCGEESFSTPDPLGNGFACAHCHGTEPASAGILSDGPVLPGHGLGDAAARASRQSGALRRRRGAAEGPDPHLRVDVLRRRSDRRA